MRTDDVIQLFGSKAAVARALSIEKSAVTQWGEYPPRLRQLEIQDLTDGALKAEPKPEANHQSAA